MLVCPHCFRTVLPERDRSCPSCGGAVGEGSVVVPLWIGHGKALPSICAGCLAATSSTQRLHQRFEEDVETPGAVDFLRRPFAAAVAWLALRATAQSIDVEVVLPWCDGCAVLGPRMIGGRAMPRELQVLVHREFRELVTRG